MRLRTYIFGSSAFFLAALFFVFACGRKATKEVPGQEALLAKALSLFQRKKYLDATAEFQKYIFNYPGGTGVDTAEFYLGLSYFHQNDFLLAVAELRKIPSAYPTSAFADDAQFYLGESHFKLAPGSVGTDQSEIDSAIVAYEGLLEEHPTTEYHEKAQAQLLRCRDRLARKAFETALLYYKLYDFRAAAISFQDFLDNHHQSRYAPEALYYLGISLEKSGKASAACEKFRAYLVLFPSEKRGKEIQGIVAKFCPSEQPETATPADTTRPRP